MAELIHSMVNERHCTLANMMISVDSQGAGFDRRGCPPRTNQVTKLRGHCARLEQTTLKYRTSVYRVEPYSPLVAVLDFAKDHHHGVDNDVTHRPEMSGMVEEISFAPHVVIDAHIPSVANPGAFAAAVRIVHGCQWRLNLAHLRPSGVQVDHDLKARINCGEVGKYPTQQALNELYFSRSPDGSVFALVRFKL